MSSPLAWQLVFERSGVAESSVGSLVRDLVRELKAAKSPFAVSLEGDPGAGKTTLVRFVFRELGLDPREPVNSPTFSYFNHYRIGGLTYFHCDFYRGPGVLDADEAGLNAGSDIGGIFVEWAEFNPGLELQFPITHRVVISTAHGLGTRDYQLFRRQDAPTIPC